MNLAIFMDPLVNIKAYKDSSIAMLKSAAACGLKCHFFTPSDLYTTESGPYAHVKQINVLDEYSDNWANVTEIGEKRLDFFDIILVRLDPPFNIQYIYALQALELAEKSGVLVANRPSSIAQLGEKTFTLHFKDCIRPSLVSANIEKLKEFWKTHQNVVYKPLDAMGGQGVFQVDTSGRNLGAILELLTQDEKTMIMAQKYIPEILTKGDKRILLINGKPIPYALARMPAPGEFRGNLRAGGTGVVVPLDSNDYKICEKIADSLRSLGLYFVGIDVIGDYLTEINITSPTCIKEINKDANLDVATDYIKFLIELRT
jgi:glutathione synthase